MKFTPIDPPRTYQCGNNENARVTISDCGRMELAPDEQITFITDSGAEYDVCGKNWGFYATPSMNSRLKTFNIRAALVKNPVNKYFVMLVEKEREPEFRAYLESDRLVFLCWLDEDETLEKIERAVTG